MKLQHKVCIVTGAAQGIGLAIAKAMAQAGANVVVHGIEAPEQGGPIAAATSGSSKHSWAMTWHQWHAE